MAEFTPKELDTIKKRREMLAAAFSPDEMAGISDADILSFTDDQVMDLLKKDEPAPVTKADLKALYDVIERQGRALDAFAEKIKSQDQNINTVNQSVQHIAEAVTPLIKTFNDFAPKADGNGNGNGKALVTAGGGSGGGKMDIMALLQNPVVQRFLGAGGGEQVNPMEHFIGQVKQVTELLSTLDEIRKPNRNAGITPGNIDMSTLLKGMQWGYRIKNGQLPPGLLQALGGDENGGEAPPNIFVVQQPAETVKHRRESDGEHKI